MLWTFSDNVGGQSYFILEICNIHNSIMTAPASDSQQTYEWKQETQRGKET